MGEEGGGVELIINKNRLNKNDFHENIPILRYVQFAKKEETFFF